MKLSYTKQLYFYFRGPILKREPSLLFHWNNPDGCGGESD